MFPRLPLKVREPVVPVPLAPDRERGGTLYCPDRLLRDWREERREGKWIIEKRHSSGC